MTLKAGAIIIGSLIWDNKRLNWRKKNLDCKKLIRVYLPIRYGRSSESREFTYTMVFSNKCYSKSYGLGTGIVVPFKSDIKSFNDLKIEAEKMGEAEGFNNKFTSNWGSVALLINPNKEIDKSFKKGWSQYISNKIANSDLSVEKLKSEKYPIDSNGFLRIRWPKEISSKNKIENLDFLIATITSPTLIKNRYPNSYKIANTMNENNYYEYFLMNRKNEITTFQDERISKIICIKR